MSPARLLLIGVATAACLSLIACAPGGHEHGGPAAPPATGATATTGTSSTPSSSTSPSGSGTGSSGSGSTGISTPAPQGRVIEIRLADGKVTPNAAKLDVAVGEQITLQITSDHADEIHVHGIDLEIPVTAGAAVTRAFTFDRPGRYEMESHEPAKIIVIFNVR